MKLEAIIYDIDGTILNTFDQNLYPLQQILKEELDIHYDYNDLLHFMSYNGKSVLPSFNIENPDKVYDRWVQYVNAYPHRPKMYDRFEEVLEYYDDKIIQALVSSKRRKQYEIDMMDFDHYFMTSVMADDTDKHKPDPAPLNKALKAINVKAENALYIGDSPFDYLAAKSAGMRFGLASWGNISREGMDDIDFIFEKPLDIIEFLKSEELIKRHQ